MSKQSCLDTMRRPVWNLPVTLVPMMRGRGISSGRSLHCDMSEIFLCCSSRIFCLFCLSAVRSSAKKADEHLEHKTT